MKACKKCGETKALSEFNAYKRNKDGLQPKCRACEKAYKKKYNEANRERIAAQKKTYYYNNKEKFVGCRAALTAANAIYVAAPQVPPWADLDAIKVFYKESHRLTKETGIKHNVDHIIPLNGELVSGLHVHTNLQVITAAENIRKHNKFEVDE